MMGTLRNFDPIQTIREMAENVYAGPVPGCNQQRFDTLTDQCATLRLVLQSMPAIDRCSSIHQMFHDLRESGLSGPEEIARRVAILEEIAKLSIDAERELGMGPRPT